MYYGPYRAISGTEPLSVTLYNEPATIARQIYCNFKKKKKKQKKKKTKKKKNTRYSGVMAKNRLIVKFRGEIVCKIKVSAEFRREIPPRNSRFRGEISRRNTAKKVYLLLRIKIN